MGGPASISDLGSCTPDNLIAGDFPRVHDSGILITGQNLKRGTVLGKITASKKLTIVNSANSDGSEKPVAVLEEDCDATSADKPCVFFLTGEFNEKALVFGGTDTAATHKDALRAFSIFVSPAVAK